MEKLGRYLVPMYTKRSALAEVCAVRVLLVLEIKLLLQRGNNVDDSSAAAVDDCVAAV